MKPVCNLKDYPPDFSRHLKALTAEELAQWDRLYRRGHEAVRKKDFRMAVGFFEKAFAIDPTYADLCFELGQLYFQKGELEKARFFFEQARDDDVVIRRAPKAILNVFNDLAKREPLYFFDTEKALVSKTPGGILGWPLIEDNVHFSLEGHALIGRALADEIAQHNWIAPRSEWQFDHERPMAEIEKELGITRRTVFLNYCAVVGYLGHRYDERLEFARRARDIFPEDPIALRLLAWAHWLLGERKQALDIYKQLGKKNPVALEIVFRAQPDIRRAYEASAAAPASSERQQKQL